MTGRAIPAPIVGSPPAGRRILFIGPAQWQAAAFTSVIAALLLMPLYEDDSLWLGAGIALMVLVGWHSLAAGRRLPWIPGLALATAALQWIVAPWITYHIGAYFTTFDMVVPASEYFAFAVPSFAALATGMLLALRRPGRRPPPSARSNERVTRRFRVTCDTMVVIGIVTQLLLAPRLGGSSLAFVGVLIGNLAFVGALALLLAKAPRWYVRVLATLTVQSLVSAANGMFHELVLWTAYFCLTLIYVYRLRLRTIVVLVASGLAAIMVLNIAKRQFRQTLATTQAGVLGRAAMLGSTMMETASDPELTEASGFKANITRLNQGWILSRVLYWVPQREPFAEGETIAATLRATLLPRFLDPNKLESGGHAYFARFTGMTLHDTSMDLSVAGEMYANFGYWGALLGIFIFGAFVGLVYRAFLRLAQRSPLWWAWAPYVLLYATKAENGISEATNNVVKSSVIMLAVITLVPAWAMLRRPLRERFSGVLHRGSGRTTAGAFPGPRG